MEKQVSSAREKPIALTVAYRKQLTERKKVNLVGLCSNSEPILYLDKRDGGIVIRRHASIVLPPTVSDYYWAKMTTHRPSRRLAFASISFTFSYRLSHSVSQWQDCFHWAGQILPLKFLYSTDRNWNEPKPQLRILNNVPETKFPSNKQFQLSKRHSQIIGMRSK